MMRMSTFVVFTALNQMKSEFFNFDMTLFSKTIYYLNKSNNKTSCKDLLGQNYV